MNYAGHEKLRAEVAEVANAMCDLRTTMNEMEQRYSFNADTLPERLVRQPRYYPASESRPYQFPST
ncbi:hypothetical protein ABUO85_003416 [Escherichia coli]|nr:hypothetical protein [Escherichia coli]